MKLVQSNGLRCRGWRNLMNHLAFQPQDCKYYIILFSVHLDNVFIFFIFVFFLSFWADTMYVTHLWILNSQIGNPSEIGKPLFKESLRSDPYLKTPILLSLLILKPYVIPQTFSSIWREKFLISTNDAMKKQQCREKQLFENGKKWIKK